MSKTPTGEIEAILRRTTGCTSIIGSDTIQELWSGYGKITRYQLRGGSTNSVIVKHVRPPTTLNQPRGWNTDKSHQRKLISYQIESHWYQTYAAELGDDCRVPICLAADSSSSDHVFVLEDLDAAGYPVRCSRPDSSDVATGLRWLANFHAHFIGRDPTGLWPVGTYWHLATRQDELDAMEPHSSLKRLASQIDSKLSECRFQTIVHGDAKIANLCFSDQDNTVAAVDFQYVGGGCGMKDVAYFLGSCLSESECENQSDQLLNLYFDALRLAVKRSDENVPLEQLESEWRFLYPFAWADFNRFLLGWYPEHHKLHRYSQSMTNKVVKYFQ